MVTMKEDFQYLGLRLDYSEDNMPSKIRAFLQEKEISFTLPIVKGTRISYVEVIYTPELYSRHFNKAFADIDTTPDEVLKSMGSSHNWSAAITRILAEIHDCKSTGAAAELIYIGKACELLAALIEMGTERVPRKARDYQDIQNVIHYINEHYKENIKQSDLVKLSHMSATKLKTLFRNFTEHSITDYISDRRVKLAEHLLSSTDMSVEDIGKEVGFETLSGFSSSFKKNSGMSPSAYRKQIRFSAADNASYFSHMDYDNYK